MFGANTVKSMLDLHGYSVKEVRKLLEDYFSKLEETNVTEFYIITGRGNHINSDGSRGVLKNALPRLLKPYCQNIIQINREEGAFKITLKPKKNISLIRETLLSAAIGEETLVQYAAELTQKAQQNDIEAILALAALYLSDNIIPGFHDINQAIALLNQAQALDSIDATVMLGIVYLQGTAIKQNHQKAFKLFRTAAQQGNATAQCYLAECYLHGKGVKYNDNLAVEWMKKAADQHDVYAQQNLSDFYLMGKITPKNEQLGIYYKTLAAEQGLAVAQIDLARCYATGYGVKKDYTVAFEWYLAAAEFEEPYAVYQVGSYLLQGRIGQYPNATAAFPWFLKAAELGDADAEAQVAYQLLLGNGVPVNVEQALEWALKAVNRKNKHGYYVMSIAYYEGLGIKKDRAKAIQLMQLAVDSGYLIAKELLEQLKKAAISGGQLNLLKMIGFDYGQSFSQQNTPLDSPLLDQNQVTLTSLREAKSLYGGLNGQSPHPKIADVLTGLGAQYKESGQLLLAKHYFEKALNMQKVLYEYVEGVTIHPAIAESLNHYASVLKALGQLEEAHACLTETLRILRVLYSDSNEKPVHGSLASALNNMGDLLQMSGDLLQAQVYFEEALAMFRALYVDASEQKAHPQVALSLNNLGTLMQDLGDSVAARCYLEEALAMQRILYGGPDSKGIHPDLALSLNNMGGFLQTFGDNISEALKYFEEALIMRKALYSTYRYHPDIASSLNNMGFILDKLGRYSAACQYLQEALQMRAMIYPPNHPKLIDTLQNLVVTYSKVNHMKGVKFYTDIMNQAKNYNVLPTKLVFDGQLDLGSSPKERYLRATPDKIEKFIGHLSKNKCNVDEMNWWREILEGYRDLPQATEYNRRLNSLPNNFCKSIARAAKNVRLKDMASTTERLANFK